MSGRVLSSPSVQPVRAATHWPAATAPGAHSHAPSHGFAHSATGEAMALGPLTLTRVMSGAPAPQGWADARSPGVAPKFTLNLQLVGGSQLVQYGRAAHLSAGDFTLCDGARPTEASLSPGAQLVAVSIPDALLRKHVPCPEVVVAMSLRGERGPRRLLFELVAGIYNECRAGVVDAESGQRMAVAVLQLLAAAYADIARAQPERFSITDAQRMRVLNHIEAHLSDPDLSPTSVARACRMTPRYLHYLFRGQQLTASKYILQRRLEESASALVSPARRGSSVTDIGLDHGFNSPTHFGRVFRARYGMTPREYRRRGG